MQKTPVNTHTVAQRNNGGGEPKELPDPVISMATTGDQSAH